MAPMAADLSGDRFGRGNAWPGWGMRGRGGVRGWRGAGRAKLEWERRGWSGHRQCASAHQEERRGWRWKNVMLREKDKAELGVVGKDRRGGNAWRMGARYGRREQVKHERVFQTNFDSVLIRENSKFHTET